MEREKMIKRMNELLKSVETLKFYLEISNDEYEINYLRDEIKSQYEIINKLRDDLNLIRGI